jgi:hypothetical protein
MVSKIQTKDTADIKFDIDEYIKGFYATKITVKSSATFYEYQR